jgi:uncharacterized protein YecT (DUF1311 family)
VRAVPFSWIAITFSVLCHAQSAATDISAEQLQKITQLPLRAAVEQRERFKIPLRSAYDRQMNASDKDCRAEVNDGQQPYNVCMGNASIQANKDFATFYTNLQMLCHDLRELTALQATHKAWLLYEDKSSDAARAAWSEGTGASGFANQIYLSILRDHMRELHEIYGLNISQ